MGFSLKAMAHVLTCFNFNCITVGLCILSCIGIVVCLKIFFMNPWISLRSEFILRTFARNIILCDVSFK